MTIAAAYLTSEGVVLGADSTTTISSGGGVVQLLNHAQKVYEIGEGTSFGFCTFGAGRVGTLSHRTIGAILGDWLVEQTKPVTTSDVSKRLVGIVAAQPKINTPLGYFVGGIDPGRTPACVELTFEHDSKKKPPTKASMTLFKVGETRYRGAPDYFTRIFHGFAQGLPQAICDALRQSLSKQKQLPPNFEATFKSAFDSVRGQFASLGATDLPLREAIDYVHTYLAATIKALKFRFGPPICGGPVEIAYISTDRSFRWACHKSFESAMSEHREGA